MILTISKPPEQDFAKVQIVAHMNVIVHECLTRGGGRERGRHQRMGLQNGHGFVHGSLASARVVDFKGGVYGFGVGSKRHEPVALFPLACGITQNHACAAFCCLSAIHEIPHLLLAA